MTFVFLFAAHPDPVMAQNRGAAAGSAEPRLLWRTVIAEDASEVEYKAFAVSKQDNSIWLVLGKRPALSFSGPQTLFLRALGASGKTLADYSIVTLAEASDIPLVPDRCPAISATDDGNIALLCGSETGLFMFMMDGETHSLDHAKGLELAGKNILIKKMLPLRGGGLLLLGGREGQATAIKLDRKLGMIWAKSAPAGVSTYLDGVALGDEGFALVGTYLASRTAQASLWIGLLSAGGEVTRSVLQPGYFVSLVSTPEDGCAMVHGIIGAQGVDYWFRSFDRDLNESWNTSLLLGSKAFQEFLLSPIPQAPADYLVVGSEKHVLWLARVRDGSSVQWARTFASQSGAFPDLVWNFGIAPNAGALVIPSTEWVVNQQRQQREIVKVVAFGN